MVLLEYEQFLTELTKLFQKSKLSGAVSISFKRYDGRTKPTPRPGKPPLPEPTEYMCLIKAKCRSKKLSTVIHQKDINKFQLAYSSCIKTNVNGLKRQKKLKTKSKAE